MEEAPTGVRAPWREPAFSNAPLKECKEAKKASRPISSAPG
jgi:hypothetical protein